MASATQELKQGLGQMDAEATKRLLDWRDMVGSLNPKNPEELEILLSLFMLSQKPTVASGIQLGDKFGNWRVLQTPIRVKEVECLQLVFVNEKTGKTLMINTSGQHSSN